MPNIQVMLLGTIEQQSGNWFVKVNNSDIVTGNLVQTFTIGSLTYNAENYVMENKIAPGLEGYFDLNIDATEADVAVRYDITVDLAAFATNDKLSLTNVKKFVSSVEVNNGIIQTGVNTYTGIITLADIQNNVVDNIKCYLAWEEDSTGNNDEIDTTMGIADTNLSIPVTVVVSQYNGETITAYVP